MTLVAWVDMDSGRVTIPKDNMDVKTQIEGFEGRRNQAYADPLTHGAPWTIGVGHCGPEVSCETVWTDEQIDAQLDADIEKARACCRMACSRFEYLSEPRQAVLIGMAFQLGCVGLLGFRGFLACVGAGSFDDAARHMMQSLWATQTPKRVSKLAAQMETGEWC